MSLGGLEKNVFYFVKQKWYIIALFKTKIKKLVIDYNFICK